MKIAQVIIGYHPTVGGYGRHVKLISDELRNRGHKVEIITTLFSPAPYSNERGVTRLRDFFRVPFGLYSYLIKNDFDLVHVHGYPSFLPFIVSLAKKRKGFPLVFTPHYHPRGTKPRLLRLFFDKFFGIPSLRAADRVIVLTDYEKGLLKDFNPVVIPNPVDLKSLKCVSGFKKKHCLRDYVLFVGRIERDKGINYLIQAVKDLDVVIIGRDVGYASDLIKQGNVHVLGDVSQRELMSAYTECSCLALPSKYEAFGIVFIEAMAYGKPVVGTRVGPVPSVVGKAGLTVPYGDMSALSKAVDSVINNKSFSVNALRQAKKYDVKCIVDDLEKIYGGVIK